MPKLALYYYDQCPFCQMVLNVLNRTNQDVELRNTLTQPENRQELINGGGRAMVPCLRIENSSGDIHWMYESRDIAQYLTSLA